MAIKDLLYGAIIGAMMLVPGVSGGSIAVYLGIYDKMIDSVANLKKNFKKNLLFLLILLIGASISVIIFSGIFGIFFKNYEPQIRTVIACTFIFISISDLFRNRDTRTPKGAFSFLIGLVFPALLLLLPTNSVDPSNDLVIFLLSLPLSLALILPGISFSFCLLLLGIYQKVLDAINDFDIFFIFYFGFGVLLGIVLFTKIIDRIMKKHPNSFKCCISGFVLFSAIQILPINYLFSNRYSAFFVLFGLLFFYFTKLYSKK